MWPRAGHKYEMPKMLIIKKCKPQQLGIGRGPMAWVECVACQFGLDWAINYAGQQASSNSLPGLRIQHLALGTWDSVDPGLRSRANALFLSASYFSGPFSGHLNVESVAICMWRSRTADVDAEADEASAVSLSNK